MAQNQDLETNYTVRSEGLLTALLNAPDLAAFFHTNTFPDRYPLQIVDLTGQALLPPDPTAGGVNGVVIGPGEAPDAARAQLSVALEEVTETHVTLTIGFPVEGVAGTARMTADAPGEWRVDSMRIVEQ